MRLLVYNRLDFQTKQSEHYILIWYTFHKDLVVWIFFFFFACLGSVEAEDNYQRRLLRFIPIKLAEASRNSKQSCHNELILLES
jgi:hypothetical protein